MSPINVSADTPQDLQPLLGDLSELLLNWSWEGVVGYEAIVETVGQTYGASDTQVFMSAQSAAISVNHDVDFVKVGIPGIPQLRNVQKLRALLNDIVTRGVDVAGAHRRVKELATEAPLYSGWLRWIGVILLAVAFSVDVVGTWEGILWAGLAGVLTGAVFLLQDRVDGFDKIAQLVATFASGIVVMLAAKMGWTAASPGLLLIAATFVFIPGDSISTQAYELAEGRWTAGVGRLFYAIIMLVLMVAGAMLAAAVTGTPASDLLAKGPHDAFSWWAAYPARVVFVLGILLAFQMEWRHFVPAVLLLLVVTAVAQGTTVAIGGLAATFVAMTFATVVADWQGRGGRGIDPYILLIPVIFALSPGSHGLRQLEVWVSGTPNAGLQDLNTLFGTLLAIAIGLVAGKVIAKPFGGATSAIRASRPA